MFFSAQALSVTPPVDRQLFWKIREEPLSVLEHKHHDTETTYRCTVKNDHDFNGRIL